jgi:hypothetical protein
MGKDKDKVGSNTKKKPQKNLKQKREAKKAKASGGGAAR